MTRRIDLAKLKDPIITACSGTSSEEMDALWPVDYLEPLLMRADPLADRIMQLLYQEGRSDSEKSGDVTDRPRRAFQFLSLLINKMAIPDPDAEHPFGADRADLDFSPQVREALQTFIREAQKLPAWVDFELIEKAQALFTANPLLAFPMLAFLSLPVLYTCGRGGTPVLMLTEQIHTKVRRRIVETGSLIMQVMQADSFTKLPENPRLTNPVPIGIEAILRVRLLHAASRTIIHEFWKDGLRDRARESDMPANEASKVRIYQNKPADKMWREEWGVPINQQYLACVLMTFSYLDLYGLEQLGVMVSDEEKRAYMHLWNVFGYLLGIDEEILLRLDFPRTGTAVYAEGKPVHEASGEEMVAVGRALYARGMHLNRATDEEGVEYGRALTKSIMDYLSGVIRKRISWARTLQLDRLPHLMMATLLSDDDREFLGAELSVTDRALQPIILGILKLRGLLTKSVGLPATILANLFFAYMQQENSAVYDELEKQTGIRYPGIPEEFQMKWGILKN